jgi:hypothetical protein
MNLTLSGLTLPGGRFAFLAAVLWACLCTHAMAQAGAGVPGTLPVRDVRSSADLAMPVADRMTVADTVRGILGYARWPDESHPLRLCVMGRGPHGELLLNQGVGTLAQRAVVMSRLAETADVGSQCDALYVGQMDERQWREIFAHLAGTPVLTICERSPICTIGGMFCLDVDTASGGVPFEVNLDSVARSGVRINPQVLRLGRRVTRSAS